MHVQDGWPLISQLVESLFIAIVQTRTMQEVSELKTKTFTPLVTLLQVEDGDLRHSLKRIERMDQIMEAG